MKNLKKILFALLIGVLVLTVFIGCKDTPKETPEATSPHAHFFGEEWVKDENEHWLECECGEKKNIKGHELDGGETLSGRVIYTCKTCGMTVEEPFDPTEVTSVYWGISIYGDPGEVLAKYELNSRGKPVRATHYSLLGYSGGIPYGILFEFVREVYEYDADGRLVAIESAVDTSSVLTGVLGAMGPTAVSKTRMTFKYDAEGRMTEGNLTYQGEIIPMETVLLGYGYNGRVNEVRIVNYGDRDDVYYVLTVKDGKIIRRDDGSTVGRSATARTVIFRWSARPRRKCHFPL